MQKNTTLLSFYAFVILVGLLMAGASFLPTGATAQSNRQSRTEPANGITSGIATRDSNNPTGLFVISTSNGKVLCRQATTSEMQSIFNPDTRTSRHIISPIRQSSSSGLKGVQGKTGLQIILRGTDQLETFPFQKATFLRAAARWESLIKSPITIVIDVDFGPTFFGTTFQQHVPGATDPQMIMNANSYPAVRAQLVASARNTGQALLANALPSGSVPTDIGPTANVTATSANLRALGLLNAIADPTTETGIGSPQVIGFNSGFTFDSEPERWNQPVIF